MAKSFKERLHKGYEQTLEISGKPLADEKTKFQRVKIFDTPSNGRVMTLDNIVQITTRDESAYAEMLTHLPMFEHGKVERIMIVGGGDLSIADEALKHKPRQGSRPRRYRRARGGTLQGAFRRDQQDAPSRTSV